jgi:hypothetical protein
MYTQSSQYLIKMLANKVIVTYNPVAKLPMYGLIWFNKNGISNILFMLEAESKGHIIPYFLWYFTNPQSSKETVFHKTSETLYTYKIACPGMVVVQTVEENSSFFSPCQISQAKEACNLHQMIG